MKYLIILKIILVSYCITILPQNISAELKKDFDKALEYYNSKKYDSALLYFQRVMNVKENNPRLTAANIFIAKVYLEQKKYSDVEKTIFSYLENYPESKYVEEAQTILLKSYIEKKDFGTSFEYAIKLINNSRSVQFKKSIKSLAENIALNQLTESEILNFKIDDLKDDTRAFLLFVTASVQLKNGERGTALSKLNEIISHYSDSDEYLSALELKKQINNAETNSKGVAVGVILSLTDKNSREIEVAKEILEGIKYAFHEYNNSNSEKIGLLLKDIKRDEQKIKDAVQEFVDNQNIKCLIGPIFSDDVRESVKQLNGSNICLISPTATDDDLRDISEYFFQANPSLSERAKIFAQYVYYVENKKSIAVINSIEGYSALLAASFSKEYERLGGKISAKETYKSKSFSLSDNFSRLISITGTYDGIYAPVSDKNDANAVLSQIIQSGLSVDLYGNQDWIAGKGYEPNDHITLKLTFDSDYFIDYNDKQYQEFAVNYKKTTGFEANRNALYGYDTAKYLLTVLRNIEPTRKNVKNKMESGINVNGYHNNISFDSSRSNKYINILRLNKGVFELVDKFRAGK